jgi:hypothetical protein
MTDCYLSKKLPITHSLSTVSLEITVCVRDREKRNSLSLAMGIKSTQHRVVLPAHQAT